jgi:hypothetical protein
MSAPIVSTHFNAIQSEELYTIHSGGGRLRPLRFDWGPISPVCNTSTLKNRAYRRVFFSFFFLNKEREEDPYDL